VGRRLLVLVMVVVSCVSSSLSVANATGGVASKSLSVAVSAVPTSATSTTVPAKNVKTVKPVKPKNKNVAGAITVNVPVTAAGSTGASITTSVVVLPVEITGLISVCANKSTSLLRDTADNSCSTSSEVKVEWLDTGISPKICVNNNNREMALAQDGKCATKNSAIADVTANKQILACTDAKTGVLRYQASGVCGTKTEPVTWLLKDQGVARNVSDAVKTDGIQIISLVNFGTTNAPSNSVTTSPAINTSPVTSTTTTIATAVPNATTTTTVALHASGSFAGYFGGTCPDGSGTPWYWGSDGTARAGGCSAAASIAPIITTATPTAVSAITTTAVTTTVAPVSPGTPATPTVVRGSNQITVSVTAGTGGTPASYTVSASPQVSGVTRTCTVIGASGSCIVTGLIDGTEYTFTASATNSSGTSSESIASISIYPMTVPGTPQPTTGIAGNSRVTLSFAANSGDAATTYAKSTQWNAFYSTAIDGTYSSSACVAITGYGLTSGSCTVSPLTNGTPYFFKIKALNSSGTSSLSSASSSVTPNGPGTPTIGIATVVSATSVTVACTAPSYEGDATITSYTATSSPGGKTGILNSPTCSSAITVIGLTSGTVYKFSVKATSSIGTSAASAFSNSVTPATLTCAQGGTCIVGNTGPGGGLVFYVASDFTSTGSDCNTTCKYLEAAPVGWGNGISVITGETTGTSTADPILFWCSNTTTLRNATTKTAIGDGRPNTATGTEAGWATCTSGAMYQAELYAGGGKTDWHMPSFNELGQMFNQKTLISTNLCCYTASTEVGATLNKHFNMADGGSGWVFKSGAYYLRPIRAFG